MTPLVIVGGFGSNWPLYRPLAASLERVSGRPVSIAPILLGDWLAVAASNSYAGLARTLAKAIRESLARHGARQVVLVAHSAGGVLARIYLGDQPYGPRGLVFHGYREVAALITLGTPHTTSGSGRVGGLNQIQFVQQHYPGAHWSFIAYTSVMARGIYGDPKGGPPERGAYQSYRLLSGEGAQWGDGVVPLDGGLLEGSRKIIIKGLRHDPRPDQPWYGSSDAIVRAWWEQSLVV